MANEAPVPARFEIEVRDLAYQHQDGAPLLARLYRPIGDGPFPALIDVHGGAWASGDRLNNAPLDEALAPGHRNDSRFRAATSRAAIAILAGETPAMPSCAAARTGRRRQCSLIVWRNRKTMTKKPQAIE